MTPDEHTNQETYLDVGDGHKLYVHDWGNMKAPVPILFLHGGPGSTSCQDRHKTLFDPEYQRVIFHDQRGSGKSTPFGSRQHNTTQDLVEDIEKIAKQLKLKKFILTGGSWGSSLALAYGIKYPKRVEAMVLRGIWTCAQSEIDWLDKGGFRDFYPDVWDLYLAATPKAHRHDPSAYHFKRALDADGKAAKESAYAYANLEGALLKLDDRFTPEEFETFDPTGTQIEIYYLKNRCFLPDRFILDNAHKLTMPIRLVQGRYDMVCPPGIAYELHQRLPNSWLIWTTSGHKDEREAWNLMRTLLLEFTGV